MSHSTASGRAQSTPVSWTRPRRRRPRARPRWSLGSRPHWPVRDRARARPRWDRARLPGTRPETRTTRGHQGVATGARGGPGCRAVPAGDQAHGPAQPPPHPAATRLGRSRRLSLLCHALRRRRVAARPARPGARAAGGGGPDHSARSGRRPGVCPRAGRRPP